MTEIPGPQPEPKPVVKLKPQGPVLSRRSFLKWTGIAAGAAVVAAEAPWLLKTAKAAPETQEAGKPWNKNIPLVSGEVFPSVPGAETEVSLDDYDVTIQQESFVREKADRESPAIATLPYFSIVKKTVLPPETKGDFTFNNVNVVYNSGTKAFMQEGEIVGWLYNGAFRPLSEFPEATPDQLKTQNVEVITLPDSATTMSALEFSQIFNNFGGEGSRDQQIADAWHVAVPKPEENPFIKEKATSPLRAWQYANTMAAMEVAIDNEGKPVNSTVDICLITGETGSCNFFNYIDPETGQMDTISKFINEGDPDNPEIYIITRYSGKVVKDVNGILDYDKTDLAVESVGFSTRQGLATAYGEHAPIISESTTGIYGNQAADLGVDINKLQEAKVFLAGMPRENQMAPKLRPELRGFNKKYYRTSPDKADYRATLTQIGQDTGTEYLYMPKVEGGGEWTSGLLEAVKKYTKALNIESSEQDVISRLVVRSKEITGGVLVEMFDPQTGIPVLDIKKTGEGKEESSSTGMRPLIEASGKHFGFFIDPSKKVETDSKIFLQEESDTAVPGAFSHSWLTTGRDTLIDPQHISLATDWINYAKQNNMRIVSGNYLVYETEVNQWLKDAKMSAQEYKEHFLSRISAMITSFPDVDTWYVGNELLQVINGQRGFDNELPRQVTGQNVIDMQFIIDMFKTARQAASEVEQKTGKKVRLGLNDYPNIVTNYISDNSVSGQQADYIFDVVSQLASQGLIDVVGLQMHMTNPNATVPSRADITQALDRYKGIVDVEVTELDLHKNVNYEEVMAGLLDSEALKGITVWGVNDEAGWTGNPDVRYLFSQNEPNENYYKVRKAIADKVFS